MQFQWESQDFCETSKIYKEWQTAQKNQDTTKETNPTR